MKKLLSLTLALVMLLSVMTIGMTAVSAAETDATNAPQWTKKKDGKIYFYADPQIFKNYKTMYMYLYDEQNGVIIQWMSKKGKMTDEGNHIFSFDFTGNGYSFDDDNDYTAIFVTDIGVQTCDLIIGNECLGDMAYASGATVENSEDSNKTNHNVHWVNANPNVYAPPIMITSIGNVVGEVFFRSQDSNTMLYHFMASNGKNSIHNAVKFSGMSYKEQAMYTGKALGLSEEEVLAIAKEAGLDLDNAGEATFDEVTIETTLYDAPKWTKKTGEQKIYFYLNPDDVFDAKTVSILMCNEDDYEDVVEYESNSLTNEGKTSFVKGIFYQSCKRFYKQHA